MNEDYNNLIFYTICEILYEGLKKTNYNTFHNLCHSIKTNINHGAPLSTEQYKLLSGTISKVKKLYALSEEETADYIALFFNGDKWSVYTECVVVVKNNLKNSFQ